MWVVAEEDWSPMRVVANSSLATAVIDYNFLSKCKAESWFFKPWISWNSLWLEPIFISPGFVFFKIFNFINLPHKTRDLKAKQIQPSMFTVLFFRLASDFLFESCKVPVICRHIRQHGYQNPQFTDLWYLLYFVFYCGKNPHSG